MSKKRIKSKSCSNCGEDFADRLEVTEYCPVCGQENHNPRLPFLYSLGEFIGGTLHLDNKVFLSAKTILFKPGKITKDWISGKRASYTSPVKLFVWSTALFTLNWFLIVDFNESFFSLSDEARSQRQQFDELPDTSVMDISGMSTLPFIEHPKLHVSELRILKTIPDDKIREWLRSNNVPDNFYYVLMAKGFKNRISSLLTLKNYIKKFTGYVNLFLLFFLPVIALVFYVFFYRKDLFYYDSLVFNLHYHIFLAIIFLVLSWPLALIMVELNFYLGIFSSLLIIAWIYLFFAAKRVFEFSWLSTLVRVLLFAVLLQFINIMRNALIDAYLM